MAKDIYIRANREHIRNNSKADVHFRMIVLLRRFGLFASPDLTAITAENVILRHKLNNNLRDVTKENMSFRITTINKFYRVCDSFLNDQRVPLILSRQVLRKLIALKHLLPREQNVRLI